MRISMIIALLLILLTLQADDSSDELWQKAKAIAEANWNWVAGEMELNVSVLDDNSSELMTSSLMFSYELEDGEICGYYEGGTRSGDLIPESDQVVQQMLSQDMLPDSSSIFYNNADWGLEVKRTGNTDKIAKRQCAEFEFKGNRPGEDDQPIPMEGSVWLELETGIPVFMTQTIYPPVEMVNKVENKVTYQYKKEALTIKKLESITSAEAMGQKVRMKQVAKFNKYWRYIEED
ncbi:MAG: hypothetical protein K9M99_07425 [Candidatus Cloacimonetes bacterium]|nr:hypothetical protein [Candidatus Cloacimonadota bacterium]